MRQRTFTPTSLAKHFEQLAVSADPKLRLTADAVAKNTKHHIKALYGDQGRLAPLQASTIEEKARRGSASPDSPLIDTGALRDGEESAVRKIPGGYEAGVGNPDPVSLYHELGVASHNLPPRPVHYDGAVDATESNAAIVRIGAAAMAVGEPTLSTLAGRLAAHVLPDTDETR